MSTISLKIGPVSFNTKGKVNLDRRTLKRSDVLGNLLYAVGSIVATLGLTKLVKKLRSFI